MLGVGEEEVLLVSVLEPGERRGEPDHDLLDAAELPGPDRASMPTRSGVIEGAMRTLSA